jgi:hypothetical protein
LKENSKVLTILYLNKMCSLVQEKREQGQKGSWMDGWRMQTCRSNPGLTGRDDKEH